MTLRPLLIHVLPDGMLRDFHQAPVDPGQEKLPRRSSSKDKDIENVQSFEEMKGVAQNSAVSTQVSAIARLDELQGDKRTDGYESPAAQSPLTESPARGISRPTAGIMKTTDTTFNTEPKQL
jgi:hypothetical protein